MWTTDGCRDSALVTLITSPRPWAACSFTSGSPFKMASLKIGRIGVIPCKHAKYFYMELGCYNYELQNLIKKLKLNLWLTAPRGAIPVN